MERQPARSFRDLIVWQKAHAFVLQVYRETAGFPKEERYGLTSQMRRAAVSIPANLAEGFRKLSKADKARFVNISQASLEEVRYYIILGLDLGYLRQGVLNLEIEEVSRLLNRYGRALGGK